MASLRARRLSVHVGVLKLCAANIKHVNTELTAPHVDIRRYFFQFSDDNIPCHTWDGQVLGHYCVHVC